MRRVSIGSPPFGGGRRDPVVQWLIDAVNELANASFADTREEIEDKAGQDFQPLDADLTAIANVGLTAAGLALLDDANPTAQLTTLGITSGTWTPTGTAVSNLDSITPTVGPYLRIGDRVICGGLVTLDFTAGGGTLTDFRLSLPVASNFAAATDAIGTGVPFANAVGIAIDADTTNDALFGRTFSPGTAAVTYSWHAIYRVI